MNYVNLNRRFVEREHYDQNELVAARIRGKLVGWDAVLESRCCVMVAPANFGKTTEMQRQAAQMRDTGQAAIYVALRQLVDRGSLEKALIHDDREAFRKWKAASVGPLTVFVDSLDEAAAGKHERIGHLVSDIADELDWPNDCVRWVISTRPAVLTDSVFHDLSDLLAKSASRTRRSTSTSPARSHADKISNDTETGNHETLRLFSMAELENEQAVTYLLSQHPELDAKLLVKLVRERGLAGFVQNPGGLDILACIDMISNPPASLTEVFERVVNAMQRLRGADHRLAGAGNPGQDALSTAAQRLAAASQICQLPNIEMPEATLAISEKALSARLIASPQLNEAAIRELLNSQLFIDTGFHQVKVYPDELLPFLAARRLAELVDSQDQAERLLENFTWAAPSGEHGVYRAYLPMIGWLATLNPHCREVVLRKDPQALAFFGDLRNPAVPLSAAREALTASIKRLVECGDRLGRGMFTLTSENYWQAGPERLAPTIASLYGKYKDDYWARTVLMDIATTCRLKHLRGRVLRRHRSDYSKLLSDGDDVRYLLALNQSEDLKALAAAALASTTAREGVVGLLLDALHWNYFSPKEVAVLIDQQFVAGADGIGLSYWLETSDILSSATNDGLYQLARGLIVRLSGHKGRLTLGRCLDTQHYADLVATVLERLARRTDAPSLTKVARLFLLFHHFVETKYSYSKDTSRLKVTLSENTPVRQALLRLVVRRRLDDHGLLAAIVFDRACEYTDDDIRTVDDPRLTRIYAEWQAQIAANASGRPKPKKNDSREIKPTITDGAKRRLTAILDELTDGSATDEFTWIADWLLQTNPSSRYGEIDFSVFEKASTAPIACAVRQGLERLWRNRAPRFDESDQHSTYYISAAGLQGLYLEFGQGEQFPALSDAEVRRALRYALIETNGYPKWFWPLVETYPEIAVSELIAIVHDASNGATSTRNAENLLATLSDAPIVARKALSGLAWEYLVATDPSDEYKVQHLLEASFSASRKVPRRDFERITLRKMKTAFQSPQPVSIDGQLQAQRGLALAWATRWLLEWPQGFRNKICDWRPTDTPAVKTFLFELAGRFDLHREGIARQIAKASDEGVAALEDLYRWTRWAVDPAEDVQRLGGIVYRPGPRDHAQRFRDSLIDSIAAATSQAAYDALNRIRLELPHGDAIAAEYIRHIQFDLRERQLTREPLPQTSYDRFEKDFQGDITGQTSFAMAVHTDLRAIAYDIECGEHSLRSFFSEVDFRRVNRKGTEGEKVGLALEMQFQRLLASELNHHARGRYSITIEPQTAESKRRDVLCSRDDWRASIELKMSARWTLEDYVVALEQQLVGQYMRNNRATIGFLVIVLQTKRTWIEPASGKRLGFPDILRILSEKAQALEAKNRSRYLRVIGIDATTPENFRSLAKRPRRSGSQKAA